MNKKYLVFGIPMLCLVLVSAGLIQYYGQVTQDVNIIQGLYIDGKGYNYQLSETFPEFTSVEAKTFLSLHNIENVAGSNVDLQFDRTCDTGITSNNCTGVTTDYQKWNTPTASLNGGSRPSVIYDDSEVTNKYKMWYWDGAMKMITSSDGDFLETGTLCTGDGITEDAFFVMKEGNTYYMINYGSPTTFNIYTSSDGLVWANQGVIYTFSDSGTYKKIDLPNLLKDSDGTYNLYFQAKTDVTTTATTIYSIFMATTVKTSLSEIADSAIAEFTGQVEALSPTSGEWDSLRVMQPMVFKEGKQYMMMYMGYATGTTAKIGYAVSSGGINFEKVDVSTEGYDTVLGAGWNPSLVNADGKIVLFYADGSIIKKATLTSIVDVVSNQMTIQSKDTQGFFIVDKFAQNLIPDTYTITTQIKAI